MATLFLQMTKHQHLVFSKYTLHFRKLFELKQCQLFIYGEVSSA